MAMPAMPAMPSMAWMYGASSSAAEKEPTPTGQEATQQPRQAQQKEPPTSPRRKPSKVQQLREGYESLVCAVVRPPRSLYSVKNDLGPPALKLDSGIDVARQDFAIPNYEGHTLQGSIWRRTPEKPKSDTAEGIAATGADSGEGGGSGCEPEFAPTTAVIYLHGNSSCRIDATRTGVLETVAPLNAALVAFDFAGSGLSGGDFVTLGWHEHHDVATVRERNIQPFPRLHPRPRPHPRPPRPRPHRPPTPPPPSFSSPSSFSSSSSSSLSDTLSLRVIENVLVGNACSCRPF